MEREYITAKTIDTTVSVSGGQVDSLRRKVKVLSTVRAYENGFIGIAGKLGEPTPELEATAVENLANGIPYPCSLPCDKQATLHRHKGIIDSTHFLSTARHLVDRVREVADKFVVSGKVEYSEREDKYSNTKNTKYEYTGDNISVEFILKDKKSANIFDTAIDFYNNEKYDEDAIISDIKLLCDNYFKLVDIDNGVYPVIFTGEFLGSLMQHLVGEMYAVGNSLFSGKLGQKLFSDNFSLLYDLSPDSVLNIPFFDAEGETGEDYKGYLVKNGVLQALSTTKGISDKYNLPRCIGAGAPYDGKPTYGFDGLDWEQAADSLTDLLPDKAIYVVIASGGDMTTSGDYATPVQSSFLMEKGQIVGRLPDIKVHSNIFNMLGKDYIGASRKGVFRFCNNEMIAIKMNVEK